MATLGCNRARLVTTDEPLTDGQHQQLNDLVARRQQGEPIAYILGNREFWSLPLMVTPATLIPRPETELLVEIALQLQPGTTARVADLGTGSGAIALALASERPDWVLMATDQSLAALSVAQANAEALAIVNVEFGHGDWFATVAGQRFDLIVSNPPYVADSDPCLNQGDTGQEPRSALASGVDGLDDLRRLIQSAPEFLVPGGQLLLEHGFDQQVRLIEILTSAGWQQITGYKDLAGLDRCASAVWVGG